jgi:hypothetical protein
MANLRVDLRKKTVCLEGERKYWWNKKHNGSSRSGHPTDTRIWYRPSEKHAYLIDENGTLEDREKIRISEIKKMEERRGGEPIDWQRAEHQIQTAKTLETLNKLVDRAKTERRKEGTKKHKAATKASKVHYEKFHSRPERKAEHTHDHKRVATKANKHERPTIVLKPGKLQNAIAQAEGVLRSRSEEFGIFQRKGELVRKFCLTERRDDRQLSRPEGSVLLESLSTTALTDVFDQIAKWRKKGNVRVDCPPKIAAIYISRTGSWRLPVLAGTISAPILREDGTILSRPGYDKKSELLLVSDEDWPAISEHPTRAEAKAALKSLIAPFAQFPFVTNEDLAVFVAYILTAIQRRVLGACPLFGFGAPAQRTGKSLLAECGAIIATGKPAPATAISQDREEMRKMITSVLSEGLPITNLDNVERPLSSPDLAIAITQPEYQDRALGRNRMLRLPTNVLWTATGNNLSFRGDLSSRALRCSLDAGVESPEARKFHISHLKDHIERHRKGLVVAALTILRAYHTAGCPRQRVEPWGGFDEWSASIREPLVWLGLGDPCKTRETVLTDDPEREEYLAALHALYQEFGHNKFRVKNLLHRCDKNQALSTAMLAVGHQKEINPVSLGWFLRSVRDRILGGLQLKRLGKSSGVAEWGIVKVPGGQSGHGGQLPGGAAVVRRFPRYSSKEVKG